MHASTYLCFTEELVAPDHAHVEAFRGLHQQVEDFRVPRYVLEGVENAQRVPILRLHDYLQQHTINLMFVHSTFMGTSLL